MVTLTMTFALGAIYWWGPTSLLNLRVLSLSIAKLLSVLVLDICPQDHLLVRTNISTKFENPNHEHCRSISFPGAKGHGDLDLRLKGHLLFRSILPTSFVVIGLIIANVFLLYVKQVTTPHPPDGGASLHHRGIIWTPVKGPLGNVTHQILKA